MTARPIPVRHWLRHGTDPLPTGAEALQQPLSAFPSWFLRITCDRCGKDRMVNEAHAPWRDRSLFDILHRMRHDGCGGLTGKAELLTGIEGVSSRPGAQDGAAPLRCETIHSSRPSRRSILPANIGRSGRAGMWPRAMWRDQLRRPG